jgi:hypothetical protein
MSFFAGTSWAKYRRQLGPEIESEFPLEFQRSPLTYTPSASEKEQ